MLRDARGFTYLELVATAAILAILASAIMPPISSPTLALSPLTASTTR